MWCIFQVLIRPYLFLVETIVNLEKTIEELQRSMLVLKSAHTEEIGKLKKEKRDELERERQRLQNQIREITMLKHEVSAKVNTQ